MPIFDMKSDGLNQIKEMPFKVERDIQKLVEQNLKTLQMI